MDLTGVVYLCPYCRVQRTVIGILGTLLVLPISGHWIIRYCFAVIGFFWASVAASQHFFRYKSLLGSKADEHAHGWISSPFYIDSFLLSGAALFIIIGLVPLIIMQPSSGDIKKSTVDNS